MIVCNGHTDWSPGWNSSLWCHKSNHFYLWRIYRQLLKICPDMLLISWLIACILKNWQELGREKQKIGNNNKTSPPECGSVIHIWCGAWLPLRWEAKKYQKVLAHAIRKNLQAFHLISTYKYEHVKFWCIALQCNILFTWDKQLWHAPANWITLKTVLKVSWCFDWRKTGNGMAMHHSPMQNMSDTNSWRLTVQRNDSLTHHSLKKRYNLINTASFTFRSLFEGTASRPGNNNNNVEHTSCHKNRNAYKVMKTLARHCQNHFNLCQ